MARVGRWQFALVVAVVLLATGCGALGQLSRAQSAALVVAGATNVQVRQSALKAQQISYDAPGRPFAWYYELTRQLLMHGWQPIPSLTVQQGRPKTYFRIVPFSVVLLTERITLEGDAEHAQITIARELVIPWRRWLAP